jgi:hypothetical protein
MWANHHEQCQGAIYAALPTTKLTKAPKIKAMRTAHSKRLSYAEKA